MEPPDVGCYDRRVMSYKEKRAPSLVTRCRSRNPKCGSGFGGLGLQRVLGDFDQLTKRAVIRRGKISQNLAVQAHFRGFEAFHESAVGGPGSASRRVNPDLPEGAEIALFGAAIAKGILAAMVNGIGGVTIKFRTAHPEALGCPDHSCAPLSGCR